jgi:glutamate racemase
MIGVFDSGVGGLFALAELRRCLPQADLLYFADTRNHPYGGRAAWELLALGRRVCERLAAAGASALFSACGTMSSVALPILQRELPLPLYGIIEATAAAAGRAYRGGRIALLATEATVAAGRLAAAIEAACHAPVTPLACPALVTMAEEGAFGREELRPALLPLQEIRPAMLVLGCTHFSRLRQEIAALFPSAVIIDGAAEAARAVADALPPALQQGSGRCTLLFSGERERLLAAAQKMPPLHPYDAFLL